MLSTPFIWSMIVLGYNGEGLHYRDYLEPHDVAKKLILQKKLLETWVSRAGGLPLSFSLLFEGLGEEGEDADAAIPLVNAVVSLSERWEFFDTACARPPAKRILPVIGTRTPILHSFSIIFIFQSAILEEETSELLCTIPATSKMRKICVVGLSLQCVVFVAFSISWSMRSQAGGSQ